MFGKGLTALALGLAAGAATALAADAGTSGAPNGFGEPGSPEGAGRDVTVAMFDNYFEPESVTAAPGETIRFVVVNEGSVVHEFNIGTADTHAVNQEKMMMMVDHGVIEIDRVNHHMMNVDMGGGHVMSHDDPNSALLAPGERAEVTWTFTEAGAFEFACNIPGHYDSGMVGDITVTP